MSRSKWPESVAEFLRNNAAGRSTYELADMINEKFGPGTMTRAQVRTYMKARKIKNGLSEQFRFKKGQISNNKGKKLEDFMSPEGIEKSKKTRFKKGDKPHNKCEIGEERINTDGYIIVKIKNEGIQRERWAFKHRLIWEEKRGPIPEGKMVEFADGNKLNLDINNLILADRREHLELNRLNNFKPRDNAKITKAQLNLIKLQIAIKDTKEGKKHESRNESHNKRDIERN